MSESNGKVALITGAARGIGRAIALGCARQGYRCALVDLDREMLEQTCLDLAGNKHDILAVGADVSSEAEVKDAVDRIEGHFGRIDILVNNAGITRDALCLRMKSDDWHQVLDINLTGSFLLCKHVIRGMMKRHWGRIISISSIVATTGNAGQVNYAASKAGLLGLTRSLAREVASRAITVNAVAPGFIETEMTAQLPGPLREHMLQTIPLKRPGSVADVVAAVLFLASPDAAYITGQTINVNGGLFM
ncbi:3-oxoacyl-[acyl-carrier-protein] reductase [bacterium]|nr:3-oxoacyl-[acyl-carrier-protein] reductase [bacterium]